MCIYMRVSGTSGMLLRRRQGCTLKRRMVAGRQLPRKSLHSMYTLSLSFFGQHLSLGIVVVVVVVNAKEKNSFVVVSKA